MPNEFAGLSGDVRTRVTGLIRGQASSFAAGAAAALGSAAGLDEPARRSCAHVLVRLLAIAIEQERVDLQAAALRDLGRFCPPLTTPSLVDVLDRMERSVLKELALDTRIGATPDSWASVGHMVRRATLEVLGAYAEQIAGREVPILVRDALTTLIATPVFELALSQELERAQRHEHPLALMLFDIDDLSRLNQAHGWGVGDRLLERLGISARRFFRTHDWVARYGDDALAVLLPETLPDAAAQLAERFRDMVQQRLVLVDHNTGEETTVTVSAAVVGTDVVRTEIDPGYVLAEAEAAVMRAKLNGRNRLERAALIPASVNILGASTLLGRSARDIGRLIRRGELRAGRRGRHYEIERAALDEYRRRQI
ncbi:MAG TPA: diguanylate cyclase [Vicinamibacterales bacterium]|nr:diguanylate cyclase [Vicinamibacterales bacterium]